MNHYERIIELITEANADSRKRSYAIAKKHGLLQRGDHEFVDLPRGRGRQGVHNPGIRGEPGTGKGGREAYVTDDDGEEYPAEGSTPRRKKKRVKESVDSVSEANFKKSQRRYRSKNPDVSKKGAKGLVTAMQQQALRGGEVSPKELKMSEKEPDLSKKMFMKRAVIFAADRTRRERSGKLKALRQFDKKPNK